MNFRVFVMKVIYWTFFFLGVLTIVAFWNSMDGRFEKAVLLWISGFWPLFGACMTNVISGRWDKGWKEFFETFAFVLFWLWGVFSWPYSYQLYRSSIDYYFTKKWYEERGIDYPKEVEGEKSFWEFLKEIF